MELCPPNAEQEGWSTAPLHFGGVLVVVVAVPVVPVAVVVVAVEVIDVTVV
jgi:hypothetical protein